MILDWPKRKIRFIGPVLAISLAAGMLTPAAAALAQQTAGPADFTAILREKMTAVVAITTRQGVQQQEQLPSVPEELPFREFFRRHFDPDQQQRRQTLGSGFFVGSDGYIVTTSHVVENADEVQIVLANRNFLPARLVGRDPSTDIAVLKVDPPSGLTNLAWGDSDSAEPGSWTIALANPFGLGGAVTVGVVSSRAGDVRSAPTDDYIQTDAATSRDYSGGPLLNTRGEVIGINTAVLSSTGASVGSGFAIPSRTAQTIADQLIRSGRVERGYTWSEGILDCGSKS
jgi:serine protease Do